MRSLFISVLIAILSVSQTFSQSPTVISKAWIANGRNFDADMANGKIYLISNNYYELDLDGDQLYSNTNIDDTGQGTFDFGPAIDVGSDGVVHVINRDGGTGSGGFNLMYSRRETNGTWSVENHQVGSPVARNYVVDVVGLSNGEAVYAHTRLTTSDVAGSVYFYGLNGTSVDSWGDFGSNGYYRVDADFRMEQYGNKMHLATGRPDPWGYVYYMNADIGPSLPTALASSSSIVQQGSGRKGMPDIKVDQSGRVFISHGDTEVVDFEKYSAGGSHEIADEQVLANLGQWHLDLGMSALGVSDNGEEILVIGLKTGGDHETASSSTMRYTYSVDGGATWSTVAEIPDHKTHAGEGRSRPRVHYYVDKFYVFYNNTSGGIGMTTIQLGDTAPPPPPVDLVDPVDLSMAKLTEGNNFDVEVANDRIYIVSDHYYEYNLAGEMYAEKVTVDDSGQGVYDFGPALAVGSGGEVHVVTRNGGNGGSGFNLYYSKKENDGSWSVEEDQVGTPVARNYVVDVVALSGGEALYAHGSEENVDGFGSLYFYNLNGSVSTSLGSLGQNDLYKVNSDFRMERDQNTLHLATGKPFGGGTVYYMEGTIGASLTSELTTGITSLQAGEGMSGMPDLRVDNAGNTLVTYGSDQVVVFNRFSSGGTGDVSDRPIFDQLGGWKLDLGLSAVASTPEGDTLLAVGLKTDGSLGASNCTLYYSYSMDNGQHWVYPMEISGFVTDAGEGRMRPRVRYYQGRFYIFFNNVTGGIGVKTIDLRGLSPVKATTPVVSPAADSVTATDNISITSSGSDAIYYSFADATPDMLDSAYAGPFTIDGDRTIHAITYRSGYLPSDVVIVSKKLKGDPPPPPPILVDPVDLSLDMLSAGKNFDVAMANDRIYLISDHYYEFNLAGTLIDENPSVVDSAQGLYDFSPAIEVGSGGEVHVITRNAGSGPQGFNLKYSKKQTGSTWSVTNNQLGIPMERNYVVDVVDLAGGEALFAHSVKTTNDVWGSLFFYTLDGTQVSQLGSFGRNDLYRVDADFRMERYQNQLHLATGKPDPDGAVYYMDADIGATLPADLAAGPTSLLAGSGRRGQPDLKVDDLGNTFITYGASGSESVFFRKYANDGSGNISDTPIFSGLGSWHLNFGLSAMAASPEGDTLLVAALKTDGTKEAAISTIHYTYSLDGGVNWVYPIEISGFQTNAGEGRMRPRVLYYRERFYIYFNNVNGGIGVKTVDLRGEEPVKTSAPVVLPGKDTLETYESVSLTATGSDAIYFSLEDASPDLLSTRYTVPFGLTSESTIHAIAYRSGYLPSDVVSVTKQVKEPPPLTDPVDLTKEELAQGKNFDVEVANHKIYLISDHYYEFDLAGDLLNENTAVPDLGQGTFDFGPAISVGPTGEVHVITRGAGNGGSGFTLHYSKKEPNTLWSVENTQVSSAVPRNYVVDVVALDGEKALYAHSKQTTDNVWGSVFFYTLDGSTIDPLGDFESDDLNRIDADFRMEQYQNELHLATGRPDPVGAVHYMHAPITSSLGQALATSSENLTGGEGRRGQPDLRIDQAGNVFVTYGSAQAVLFNRYSSDGSGDVEDLPILSQLGTWHLDLGLSAIASTPNGDTLLAVGLKTDNTKEAPFCTLYYTYSFDGGRNWAYRYELPGYQTSSGEGRMRPRVKFYCGRFYIFFNNVTGGIAVTTIDLRSLVLDQSEAPVIMPSTDSVYTYEPISMTATQSDAIFYSFSDSNPGLLSSLYEAPFTIGADRIIYARAYRSGYLASDVISVDKKAIITSVDPKEEMNNQPMDLYPVPVSTHLSVEWKSDFTGELTLRVLNNSGQLVYLNRLEKSGLPFKHDIDVSDWPEGIYMIVVQNGPVMQTRKFVVH